MTRYTITIVTAYEIEIEGELTPELQQHITDNYEVATLPSDFEDPEYLWGTVTYEEVTE